MQKSAIPQATFLVVNCPGSRGTSRGSHWVKGDFRCGPGSKGDAWGFIGDVSSVPGDQGGG